MQVFSCPKLLILPGALALAGLFAQVASADDHVTSSAGASGGTGPNLSGHTAQDNLPPEPMNLEHTAQDGAKPKWGPDDISDPPTFEKPVEDPPTFNDPASDGRPIPGLEDPLLDLLAPASPAAPNPLLLLQGEPDFSDISLDVDPVGSHDLPDAMYTSTSSSVPSPGALIVLGLGALTRRRRRKQ